MSNNIRKISKIKPFIPDNVDCCSESHLEVIIEQKLAEFLNENTTILSQVSVTTICGTYRLDLVLEHQKTRIGVECDGDRYHKDTDYDRWRDALIIGTKYVKDIVRIPASLFFRSKYSCIALVAHWYPIYFTPRNVKALLLLAHDELRDSIEYRQILEERREGSDEHQREDYAKELMEASQLNIEDWFCLIRRADDLAIYSCDKSEWETLYNFAVKNGGGDIRKLINMYNEANN